MRLRLRTCRSLIIVWLLAFAASAWSAQQPAAPNSPAPAVIAVTDVIPRSERVLIRLRDIRNALEADRSVTVVEAALPSFSRHSDEWWLVESAAIQQLHSVQRINDVTWQLHLYEAQVAAWNGLLTASSRKWSAEKETLDLLIAEWEATQSALDNSAPPVAVSNKLEEVLRESKAAQLLFQQKTAQLVAVQDKLASRLTTLNEIRSEIETVRLKSAANLLAIDSSPLWTALFAADQAPSALAQFNEGAIKIYRDTLDFYELYRRRMLLHLALILVLVVLYFRLRYLSRQPGEIAPTEAERFILDRSSASALLVALLAAPLMYPDVSPQMMRILLIPAIVPLLMLLPAIFGPQLRIAYYLLLAVYLLDLWRYYLPQQWWLVRILLIVESLLGIGVVYLIYRAKVLSPAADPSRKTLIRSVLRIGFGLFTVAICANIIGDFTLAEFLVAPVLRTLYMGVAIHLLTVVATTFGLMALHSRIALLFRTVQQHRSAAAETIRRLARLLAAGLWIGVGLFNFGVLGFVQNLLEVIFGAQWKLGAVEISVEDIVMFTMVFGAAYVLSRILRFILAQEIFPRFHMPRGVPDALELLSRYGVLLFGFLLALVSAGVNLSQLTLALSALGVGIGFGLQNIVNNFVCGLILVFEHPIQVGDFVEVGPHSGRVQRIGFRSSSVNTLDGGNVIIPNSELIGTRVTNWSLSDQLRRITLRIPVPLDTDPNQVIDMFQGIARRQPDVVAHPAPNAAMEKFGGGSLNFILRCWTQTEKYESTGFKLTLAINNALQEAGIQIPIAQSDVHLHWPEKAGAEIQSVERLNELAAGVGSPPKATAGS